MDGLTHSKTHMHSPSWDETAKVDRMSRQRWEVIGGSIQAETQTCILLQSSPGGARKPPHSLVHGVSWERDGQEYEQDTWSLSTSAVISLYQCTMCIDADCLVVYVPLMVLFWFISSLVHQLYFSYSGVLGRGGEE